MDWLKGLFAKKETSDHIISRADIPQDLYSELEREWYKKFDFMKLYQPLEPTSSLLQYMGVVGTIVSFITLISVWAKH